MEDYEYARVVTAPVPSDVYHVDISAIPFRGFGSTGSKGSTPASRPVNDADTSNEEVEDADNRRMNKRTNRS